MEELFKLLKRGSAGNRVINRTNFRVGRRLSEIIEWTGKDKDSVVQDVLGHAAGRGHRLTAKFLYESLRVYRSIRTEETLDYVCRKLGGAVSWGFLARNCAKAPSDGEEARLYWEGIIGGAETALEALENLSFQEGLPEDVREQLSGLLTVAAEQGYELPGAPREVLDCVKIAHMADLHMYEGFTTGKAEKVDPETGKNERLLDLSRIFGFMADRAVEAGCSLCLITEPFETPHPTPNEQGFFQATALRLAEHMPVIIEPGNHGLSKEPKDASALEFLKGRRNIFVVEKPAVLFLEGKNLREQPSGDWPEKDCAKVFILPFPGKALVNGGGDSLSIEALNEQASNRLRVELERFRMELDPDVPNILLAHMTVEGAQGMEDERKTKFDPHLHPEDLMGFDYAALGHIHIHQQIPGAPNAHYAGSPERLDFNDEGVEKGFLIARFDGKQGETEFVRTPAREYVTLGPEFLLEEGWEDRIDPRGIYRVKGELTREKLEEIKPALRSLPPNVVPKITVKREVRVRDREMTEDMSETDALRRFLETQAEEAEGEVKRLCLELHNLIASGELKGNAGKDAGNGGINAGNGKSNKGRKAAKKEEADGASVPENEELPVV